MNYHRGRGVGRGAKIDPRQLCQQHHCKAVIVAVWIPRSLGVYARASITLIPRNSNIGLLDTSRPVNGTSDRDIVTLTVASTVPAGALSGVFVLLSRCHGVCPVRA
jgi:hypothetical protein